MKVRVKLLSYLADYAPDIASEFDLELEEGAGMGDLKSALGIEADLVCVALVNGRLMAKEQALESGDSVTLFPQVDGG